MIDNFLIIVKVVPVYRQRHSPVTHYVALGTVFNISNMTGSRLELKSIPNI